MVFESKQVISLVTWMAIFLFETYSMTRSDIEWYRQKRSKRLPSYLQLNEMVFPVVWFILKGCLITSHFLYFEYATANFGYWTFLAVAITTLINIVLNKTWTMLFFGWHRIGSALLVSTLLFVSSVLVTVFMGLSQPVTGDMYWLPLILYIPYSAWLGFAWWINYNWYTDSFLEISLDRNKGRVRWQMRSKPRDLYKTMDDINAPIDHKPMV